MVTKDFQICERPHNWGISHLKINLKVANGHLYLMQIGMAVLHIPISGSGTALGEFWEDEEQCLYSSNSIFYSTLSFDINCTFNNNVFRGPLFLKSCKQTFSSDANNMFFKIKFLCVETKKSQPELPNRFCISSIFWPTGGLEIEGNKGYHEY